MSNESNEMVRQPETQPEHVRHELRAAPPVDVYENADELLVVADVPGVTDEALDVQLDGTQLTLEARQPEEEGEGDGHQPLVFARTFTVPRGIDAGKVSADLDAGVLSVHLPKAETAKPRKIEVKGG